MEKDMKIEIFGKTQCPFCDKAKFAAQSFIQETPHTYEYKLLGADFDMSFVAENFPTARTFPQIRIDGENIGGYTEFVEYLDGHR
tara:strand:+ start:639 stop:893 length:255 start_codon:yes stop_codon:yes gene_type:complete